MNCLTSIILSSINQCILFHCLKMYMCWIQPGWSSIGGTSPTGHLHQHTACCRKMYPVVFLLSFPADNKPIYNCQQEEVEPRLCISIDSDYWLQQTSRNLTMDSAQKQLNYLLPHPNKEQKTRSGMFFFFFFLQTVKKIEHVNVQRHGLYDFPSLPFSNGRNQARAGRGLPALVLVFRCKGFCYVCTNE